MSNQIQRCLVGEVPGMLDQLAVSQTSGSNKALLCSGFQRRMCYARSRLLVTHCSRVIRVIMARRQLNLLNCWGHNVVSRDDAEGQSQAMDSADSATTEEPPPKRRAAARVHLSTVIGWQATSFPWIELEEEGGVVAKVFCKY